MSKEWLDEIALAYADTFADLEAARAHFMERRVVIVDALAEFMRSEALRTGLKVTGESVSGADASGPWTNIRVSGEFSKVRKAADSDGSGIGCGFASGDFWADGTSVPLGVFVYLSFSMKKQEFKALQLERLYRECCSAAVEVRAGGGGVYLVGRALHPGAQDFTWDGACDLITRVIATFPAADGWIAQRYSPVSRAGKSD